MKKEELLKKLHDEIGISEVLSPTEKAARVLKSMLPDLTLQLSDDTRHFYHLATDSFVLLKHTIDCACPQSKVVSFDEFRKELLSAKSTDGKQFDKISNLSQKVFDEFVLSYKWLEKEKFVFVYNSFMDTRSKADYADYYRVLELFSHYCGQKRYDRNYNLTRLTSYDDMFDKQRTQPYNMLFFVTYGAFNQLPENLRAAAGLITYPPLDSKDFRKLLWEYYARYMLFYRPDEDIPELDISQELLEWYKNQMAGFGEKKVRILLSDMPSSTLIPDYTNREKIESSIAAAKKDVLKQNGRLELVESKRVRKAKDGETENQPVHFPGRENIRDWIENHRDAIRNNNNAPTGILLVGIPGTGKSATAKMVASTLELPLVQLDMSRILGGRVGDSEKGMREMLDDLRFAAPCVLWIDEVEKAMSGADGKSGDGGTIRRLFGMLLTFIQENDRPVFTVTTANDVSKLPPEFFRNGRFDQTFCLMMPNYNECCDIMCEKLYKYLHVNRKFAEDNKRACFDACVGTPVNPRFLTGADIEAHVKELMWQLMREDPSFTMKKHDPKTLQGIIVEGLKDAAKTVRSQASPSAKQSMENVARSYMLMIQQGFTMAGKGATPFTADNLDIEAVQSFSFDPDDYSGKAEYPDRDFYCMKDNGIYSLAKYKEFIGPKSNKSVPAEWYDVVFYFELAKAIGQVVLFDKELTMEEVRRDYWKLIHKIRESKK